MVAIACPPPRPEPLAEGLPGGKLAENVLYFARALRAAGLPIGPGAVLDAIAALEAAPFTTREDFRALLHAVMVKSHEHEVVFDGVFRIFWKRRGFLEQLIASMSPRAETKTPPKAEAGASRVAEALFSRAKNPEAPKPSLDLDARFTTSADEVLRRKDFAQMSADEVARATALIATLRLPADDLRTRRAAPDRRGALIDPRRSFRRSLRAGGATIDLARRAPAVKVPPVVAICDISGSVSDYTRVFLHFLHALSARRKVHSFLFGTRLTNISRALRHKDVDDALASASANVEDWSGGTRIAQSLHAFNKLWLRRVLGQSATVILFTDGLERDGSGELVAEMARLRRSCRRLIWLNPLLRYDAFEARAAGIRAMLPFVDEFRPVHNVAAVADLCRALAGARPGEADPKAWLTGAAA